MALDIASFGLLQNALPRYWKDVGTCYRWTGARDSAIVALGCCGLRTLEIQRVLLRDVDSGRLFVRTSKGGRERTVTIGGRLEHLLHRLRAAWPRAPGGRGGVAFFTRRGGLVGDGAMRRGLRVICKRLEIRQCSFHDLRAAAAVRLYRVTNDVLEVQRFLGHKSLQSTWWYLQSTLAADDPCPPEFAGGPGEGGGVRLFDPEGRCAAGRRAG